MNKRMSVFVNMVVCVDIENFRAHFRVDSHGKMIFHHSVSVSVTSPLRPPKAHPSLGCVLARDPACFSVEQSRENPFTVSEAAPWS